MSTADVTLNMFNMAAEQLRLQIKQQLTAELIAEALAEYEATIRPKIEAVVSSLIIDRIESFQDLRQAREEFHVYLEWKGETPKVFKSERKTGQQGLESTEE